jgi:hypothetical protein
VCGLSAGRNIGRVGDRSYAGIWVFNLNVDPIAAHTCARIGVSQQNGMSWFMVEVFQHSAGTDSTCRSTGMHGNFQYFAERADGIPSRFDCPIPACVRHHDDPQRVSPTSVAVGRKYAEDTLGNCVCLVSRRYDNANCLDCRRRIKLLAIRGVARSSERLHDFDHDLRIAQYASISYQKSTTPHAISLMALGQAYDLGGSIVQFLRSRNAIAFQFTAIFLGPR